MFFVLVFSELDGCIPFSLHLLIRLYLPVVFLFPYDLPYFFAFSAVGNPGVYVIRYLGKRTAKYLHLKLYFCSCGMNVLRYIAVINSSI